MADIKLTLSQHKCISREAEHMEEQGGLLYPLHTKPKETEPGCWVYFILRGHLVARAKAIEFVKLMQRTQVCDYDGKNLWKRPGWWVKCAGMELPLPSPGGFRGFQIVRGDEQQRFEWAFDWLE